MHILCITRFGGFMAWECTLYTGFSKRLNSTMQPSGGTVYPCLIKNDTDFKNPVLQIQAADLSDVNYMQFNGEFFYVTSLISHRTGVWEVAGLRDPMATYKGAIGGTAAFQLYGGGPAADDAASRVPDERLAVKRVPQITGTTQAIPSGSVAFSPNSGTFILSAVGESGGVGSYALNSGQMTALLNTLGQDTLDKIRQVFGTAVTPADETEALTWIRDGLADTMANELAFGNAIQAIRDCHWIPFLATTGAGAEVVLGDFHTGVYGLLLGNSDILKTDSFAVAIPWPVSDWKRNNCLVQISLPLCGIVPLPVDKINTSDYITVKIAVDLLGGNVSYLISCGGVDYNLSGANSAVPYAIGSSNVSLQNFIGGTLQAVGGGIQAAGGVVSAAVSAGIFGAENIAGGISSMAQGAMTAVTPQIQCSGSVGGCSAIGVQQSVTVTVQYYEPIDEEATQAAFGHPVFAMTTPTGGYNCFRGFSVHCGGTPDEISRINAFFNSGAYYE